MRIGTQMARFALIATLVLFSAGSAWAEPKNGFGLFGGFASHSAEGTFLPAFGGTSFSYSSSGLSGGVDYQFAISPSLSINPFLVSSAEGTSGDLLADTTAGHGIFGVGLRYWPGDVFFGAHVGSYSEALTGSGRSSTTSASGTGVGFSVGWESPDGLMMFGQYDTFSVSYSDADVDLTGLRLHIGYRWK
jgi:hypothetical protein